MFSLLLKDLISDFYFHTSCVRTAKALAMLRGCAGSPEPSLVAYVISTKISRAVSNVVYRLTEGVSQTLMRIFALPFIIFLHLLKNIWSLTVIYCETSLSLSFYSICMFFVWNISRQSQAHLIYSQNVDEDTNEAPQIYCTRSSIHMMRISNFPEISLILYIERRQVSTESKGRFTDKAGVEPLPTHSF